MPKAMIVVALLVLIALASTLTYTGFLVVGVLADLLGTGRFIAGLLLGLVFARFPRFRNGKLTTVGLLPKSIRRPVMVSMLALCAARFVWQSDYVPALFLGFATAFLLAFPWLKRAIFARVLSSIFKSPGSQVRPQANDDMVIDGEFKEKRD